MLQWAGIRLGRWDQRPNLPERISAYHLEKRIMENRSGTIAVTSDSLLIMLDWTGLRPFVNPGDPDSYREDFSGVIIGPEQHQIGRPCGGKLIRPVAHVSDLISPWQLAGNLDLSCPPRVP